MSGAIPLDASSDLAEEVGARRRPQGHVRGIANGLRWEASIGTVPDPGSEALAVALAQFAATGDRAAFEDIYRLTSARLFGACLTILHDRERAEEALQDAYLAVWRKAKDYDPARGRPMTWLLAIARNRAIDRLRADRGKPASASGGDEPATSPANLFVHVDADQEARDLARCLGSLETSDCTFIRAAFFEGRTYSELAARSALPLGTLKSRMRRALLKLRECLA